MEDPVFLTGSSPPTFVLLYTLRTDECRFLLLQSDNLVFTRLNAEKRSSTMCPNCFTSIAMALGGAGSAVLLTAAGLRFRTARAPETDQPNAEETRS